MHLLFEIWSVFNWNVQGILKFTPPPKKIKFSHYLFTCRSEKVKWRIPGAPQQNCAANIFLKYKSMETCFKIYSQPKNPKPKQNGSILHWHNAAWCISSLPSARTKLSQCFSIHNSVNIRNFVNIRIFVYILSTVYHFCSFRLINNQ